MKLKFTFILLFVVVGLQAQKQIQPYNYSVTIETTDKISTETATIMIYASAEAVNSITFTLKDAKNNILENDKGENITFKVFPFTETSFRKFLNDAIKSIKETENTKELEVFKKRLNSLQNDEPQDPEKNKIKDKVNKTIERKNTVLEIRNIFQFFEALVITAFQYDTEPVAGVLKYRDTVKISKKNIEGLDIDTYFERQSKFIRKIIFDSKGYNLLQSDNVIPNLEGKYSKIPIDGFIDFLSKPINEDIKILENNNALVIYRTSYLWKLLEFHQNSKRGNKRGSRVLLKKHIKKELIDWYNIYELSEFTKKDMISNYFELKFKKTTHEDMVKNYETNILVGYNNQITKLNIEIDTLKERLIDLKFDLFKSEYSWEMDIDYYNLTEKEVEEAYEKQLEKERNNYSRSRDSLKNIIQEKNTNIKSNKSKHDSIKDVELPKLKILIKEDQNEINFLIAKHKNSIDKVPIWKFAINNIEIDFNDGFIEHIVVSGNINEPNIDEIAILNTIDILNQKKYFKTNLKSMLKAFYKEPFVKEIYKNILDVELKFENEYPIGFSSKTDFADLDNYYLYSFKGFERIYSLRLTEIIKLYIQKHQNDRLDFSPEDQIVRLPLDDLDKNNEIELKKEKSSKILNAKIFTDFNGLQESKPNGLVQIEIEKQIPLWTKRMDLGLGRSSNVGFANYAIFNLTWAKLNEEDRKLQVNYSESFINNQPQVDKYVTYLELIKFENVSIGLDLNIASFDFPLLKSRLELNTGAHYGRVKVVDTLTNDLGAPLTSKLEKDVNMIRFYPDIILRIRPEERFGGYLRFRPFKTIVPDNEEFFSVYSAGNFTENTNRSNVLRDQRWLQRYELGAYYTPNPKGDNKFFFRYRYTNTSNWETNGYSEIQLGYQIYLKF
nr:hypothetical protein [uncultured Psychroserpens sp.]